MIALSKGPSWKFLSSIFLILLLSFSIVSVSSTPVLAKEQSSEFVPGQVIVSFKSNANSNEINGLYEKFSKSHGVSQIKSLDHKIQNQFDLQERLVKVPPGQERKFLEILSKNPHVEYVGLNYIVHADTEPNDSSFPFMWGMHNTGQNGGTVDADIDAPAAWDVTIGSSDIIVGVIDTGVDYNHPDLAANIWSNPGEIPGNGEDDDGNGYVDDIHGINTITGSGNPMDDNNHGTHTSGTIGAVGDNDLGVTGVNWNVKIIGCKFLNSQGSGSTADAQECVEYFNELRYTQGIEVLVINNSWSGGFSSAALKSAFEAQGPTGERIIHVMSAGNGGPDEIGDNLDMFPLYPASYDILNNLVVAASDRNDNIAIFSNYGANTVDLAAPGVGVLSTLKNQGYGYGDGTSMAAPHVAGAAALLFSANPSLSYVDVQNKILSTVDPITSSKPTSTEGRLNVGNVMSGDFTAPSPVTITIDQTGFSTIDISFISTGDDGTTGTASSYDVRYSTSLIADSNWDNATPAIGEPVPQPSGNLETFQITGLQSGTNYYIGVKVRDEAGNHSPLSGIKNTTTDPGTVLVDDNMEGSAIQPASWTTTPDDSFWHISSIRPNSPTQSWYYGDETSNNYDGNTNSGILKTQLLDLTDAQQAQLKWFEWSEVEEWIEADRTRVMVFDGTDWHDVFESHGTNGIMEERLIDLGSFVGMQIIVGFDFNTEDGIDNDHEGWYVDDVKISKYTEGTTPPSNQPPTSNAGADQTVEDSDDSGSELVTLDGAGSSDDTAIASYDWKEGLSNIATGVSPSVSLAVGIHTITLTVTDGKGEEDSDQVVITVNSANEAPVADDQVVEVNEDDELPITLTATDDDELIYSVMSGPSNGILSGNVPDLTYTPNLDFNGGDVFTFNAADGIAFSNEATVTITVNPVNDAPTAFDDAHVTDEDTPTTITLSASDVDGDTLTYTISGPSNGALSGTAPNLTYTPDPDSEFDDVITFTASDGTLSSNEATIAITVNPVNDVSVSGFDVSTSGNKRWTGYVTINVVYQNGTEVNDASVSGTWSNGANGAGNCTIDAGQCTVSKTTKNQFLTYTVNSITGSNVSYSGLDSVTLDKNGPISGGNPAPVADAGIDQTVNDNLDDGSEMVTLDGTGSSDDTGIASYVWEEGGSDIGTGATLDIPLSVGVHTITLTVTDDDSATDSDTVVITVSANTPDVPVHIASLTGSSEQDKGPWWRATVNITVHNLVDTVHTTLVGVVVHGTWSGSISGSDTCTTVADGTCIITDRSKSSGNAMFEVIDLTGNGFSYNSAINHDELDNPIDGTVVISPP